MSSSTAASAPMTKKERQEVVKVWIANICNEYSRNGELEGAHDMMHRLSSLMSTVVRSCGDYCTNIVTMTANLKEVFYNTHIKEADWRCNGRDEKEILYRLNSDVDRLVDVVSTLEEIRKNIDDCADTINGAVSRMSELGRERDRIGANVRK